MSYQGFTPPVSGTPHPRFVWNPVGNRIEDPAEADQSEVHSPEANGWQNWNSLAEMWIHNVHKGVDAECQDFMVTQPLMDLVGDITSKRVLDAGCGEGFYSRKMAELGAIVTGIDSSEKLIESARSQALQHQSTYNVRSLHDLTDLGPFDVIVTNQVINLVPNLSSIFHEFANVVAESGRLIVGIPHPCFDGIGSGWSRRPGGQMFWTGSRYGQQVSGRASHGAPAFHRPISHYITAARTVGFALVDMKEPVVPEEAFPRLNSADFEYVDRPANLFFHFVRRADLRLPTQ